MELEVRVTATMEVAVDMTTTPLEHRQPGPAGARYRFAFSDDLILERIDNVKYGSELPEDQHHVLAGTHSGFVTTIRLADAHDTFFPDGSMLFHYEGTYVFDAVTVDLPTALPRGQLIARGVALLDRNFAPLKPVTFAIVGGTGAYDGTRGQVTHSGPDGSIRTLKIAR